jgi:hypothetical protein
VGGPTRRATRPAARLGASVRGSGSRPREERRLAAGARRAAGERLQAAWRAGEARRRRAQEQGADGALAARTERT